MRTKVTLILVFLNVALFFFIFYVRPRWVTIDQLKAAQTRVLPPGTTDIKGLEISAAGQSIRLAKRGEIWNIEQPVDWPANFHAVDRIIKELQVLEHKAFFDVASLEPNKLSLADYGLDKPLLTITLNPRPAKTDEASTTGAPLTLRIGNATNVGNRLYVLSPDGQRVHIVDSSLASSITQTIEQLRSSSLFSIQEHEVRSLNIQLSGDTSVKVHVKRESANRWSLESPVIARANTAEIRRTITMLSKLELGAFVSQAPSPEADPVNATVYRITLGGNNRSETLLIGGPVKTEGGQIQAGVYYAQIDKKQSLFTVKLPDELVKSLHDAQNKLRETRLFDLEPAQITSLVLGIPARKESITLQRLEAAGPGETSAWQFVRRSGEKPSVTLPADTATVQSLLEKLSRLSAQSFLSDAPNDASIEEWGFNSPEREIEIRASASQRPVAGQQAGAAQSVQVLQIGVSSDRGPKAYARLDSARYVYEVNSEILRDTSVDALAWRDRNLRSLPAGARIVSLKLTDLATQKVILERSLTGTDNESLVPKDASPEQTEAWAALLAQLRVLRAKSFVADSFSDSFSVSGEPRTWRFRLEAGIELSGGAGSQANVQTLLLSERLGGVQQVAGARDLDSVFLIEQPFMDALWTLTREAVLPPASESGTSP